MSWLCLIVKNLKVAVVGMGKMGMLHASILNTIPGVELVALCDKNFLIRRFLRKVFKEIAIVNSVNKLSKIDLDAVYVTTPVSSHYSVAKAIYSENIASNLFVEKTLASNFGEAKELCELARDSGGVNMVGYMRRFAVTFQKAKNLLDKEVVGEPVLFKAYAYSSDFYGVEGNLSGQPSNVGVVRDLGCHAIDLALWFFGDLEIEEAKIKSIVSNGVEDSAYAEVMTTNGLRGEFDISWCIDKHRIPEVGITIEGSEGTINVNDDKLELNLKSGRYYRWFRHDLRDIVAFWLGGPEFFREDDYFVKSVICNHVAEPSFYTSARVDRIIDKIKAKAD